jgi:hypothetical protein
VTTQETATNAFAAASSSGVALAAAVAVTVLFWLGIEWALDALDLHLPARQLMQGRSTDALPAGLRWAYWQVMARLARGRRR